MGTHSNTIKHKPRLTVLTGAGISVESGLSTFRDADGLWAEYRVEDICTPQALAQHPQRVINFYNKRRLECAKAQPNQAHLLLAQLEKYYNVTIVTQNVDDLHERAGSSHVIHLHGELMKCASVTDPYTPLPLPNNRLELSTTDTDDSGAMLRPFIVFFGEQVPRLQEGIHAAQQADLFVVIGTSLVVYPAASLLHYVPVSTPIYLIDPNEVQTPRKVVHLRMGASQGVKELAALLNLKIPYYGME